MLWTNKYKPKTTKEVIGQESNMASLRSYIINYHKVKKKALLLSGPTGCGKTTSIYALASELNYEVLEVNASDTRNAEALQKILGSASKQMSLFGRGKIIMVDELDGLSGMEDRGGVGALTELIEDSAFPIILITADPYDRKISSLRAKCEIVKFTSLSHNSITQVLKNIAEKEKVVADESALKTLARMAGGDARAAITDLQILCENKKLPPEKICELGERRQIESIINALMKILKTTDVNIAVEALDNVEEDFDELILWLEENIPKEYLKPKDLSRAFETISKADVFSSRIRRWQYWRLLVYIRVLLSSGIAVAKDAKYEQYVAYKPTQKLLKLWRLNTKTAKKKSIAEKIASSTHCSCREALKQVPYFQVMEKKYSVSEELKLNSEEKQWLCKC